MTINILLIEDSEFKAKRVYETFNGIEDVEITHVGDVKSAMIELVQGSKNYDLLVLDMGLPQYSDSFYIEPRAGLDILDMMEGVDRYPKIATIINSTTEVDISKFEKVKILDVWKSISNTSYDNSAKQIVESLKKGGV